jgi:hypothetical protein
VPPWLGSKSPPAKKISTKRGKITLNNVPFLRLSSFSAVEKEEEKNGEWGARRKIRRKRDVLLERHYRTQFRLPNAMSRQKRRLACHLRFIFEGKRSTVQNAFFCQN